MKTLLLILSSLAAFAQAPWDGILATSRATDWSTAGLPGTLPTTETTANPWTPPARATQCGATITTGASAATINTALEGCTPGQHVLLGTGTFTIGTGEQIEFFNNSGVTLRGSGPQSTKIVLEDDGRIAFGQSWGSGGATVTSGLTQGSTSITYNSKTGIDPQVGMFFYLNQCDDGYSAMDCETGSTSDGGGLYICGNNAACQTGSGAAYNIHQGQVLRATDIDDNGGGSYTVTFTPALYMPNWSTSRTARLEWFGTLAAGVGPEPDSNGLENLTVEMESGYTGAAGIELNRCYACWIKGVRMIGIGTAASLRIQQLQNFLVANNYFYTALPLANGDNLAILQSNATSGLILNNIGQGGVIWEGTGANVGNVVAYNYCTAGNTAYYWCSIFEHFAGSSFNLYEGNSVSKINEDNIWGTKSLDTDFRNAVTAGDPPYLIAGGGSAFGIGFDKFSRFMNAIGNVIGSAGDQLQEYKSTCSALESYPAFRVGVNDGSGEDSVGCASAMLWGNYDTITGTARFESSEVPTALSGAAEPFENSVPGSEDLPPSFFMDIGAFPSGGTGLSWWKVCTNYPTCSSTSTPPFPAIGPDVTGAPLVAGHVNYIPAALAFNSLPVDSAYNTSYTITGSSYSMGVETLTITGLPSTTHIIGPFAISGGPCEATGLVMTASSSTTISYAVGSDPGNCEDSGGEVVFPQVRQFDPSVYETDSTPAAAPPQSRFTGNVTTSGGVR